MPCWDALNEYRTVSGAFSVGISVVIDSVSAAGLGGSGRVLLF